MTQAFNLAQLANNLNTSGQLDGTDGLSGLIANANLASSGTASSSTFLRGDRTWATLTQKVLQVVSSTRTSTASGSTTGVVAIGGLSVSITPSSTSNKILLIGMLSINCSNAGRIGANFLRNSTSIGIADSDSTMTRTTMSTEGVSNNSNNMNGANIMLFLDSPSSTSALTYEIAVNNFDNQPWYINRNSSTTDSVTLSRAISTIVAMEIS
jgi:hypothetical protein